MEQRILQDILKMSLKLTDQEEINFNETEIDEDRKKWLEEVLQKTLDNDDANRIVKMTKVFLTYKPDQSYTEEQIDEIEELFEELNYLVEGFDIGKLFNQIGGMEHNLQFLMKSPHEKLKVLAANLIGNSTHNNPTVQTTILQNKGMETLVGYIKTSTNNDLVVKSLYALSTLVGGFEDAEKYFSKIEKADFFIKLFRHSSTKVKTKAAFLLMKLCNSEFIPIEHFITRDLVRNIIDLLKLDHEEWYEHLLCLLVPCLRKSTLNILFSSIQEKNEAVHLFKSLLQKYQQSGHQEAFEKEIESCKTILDIFQMNSGG